MRIAPGDNGFSMIELIVALVVMGILTAIALPNWNRLLPAYALNNSVRQIQSELHSIKMRAAAENVGFQFAYVQGANDYTIQRDSKALVTKPIAEGTNMTKNGDDLVFAAGDGERKSGAIAQ